MKLSFSIEISQGHTNRDYDKLRHELKRTQKKLREAEDEDKVINAIRSVLKEAVHDTP